MKNEVKHTFGECATETKDKIIVLKERQSKFIGKNESDELILKVKVDKCLDFHGKKCDFLLINTMKVTGYFIELKGHDFSHALEQIKNTIDKITEFLYTPLNKKRAYIISNRSPHTPRIQKAKLELRKKGVQLYTSTRTIEVNLND